MKKTIYQIPICIIGAGSIVGDAHLPAYKLAGYYVKEFANRTPAKALALAEAFGIEVVYNNLSEMIADNQTDCVYDLTLPASEIISILEQLPDESTVLIQKPLGESLDEARAIHALCGQKKLIAGVNFQLRFAPFVLEAKRMINEGLLGTLLDLEVYVNVFTPWKQWGFLSSKKRTEINYHSIHYIDMIRSILGTPQKVFARTFRHPNLSELSYMKSNILMDYGNNPRAVIHTHHDHFYNHQKQEAYIKIEGTKGAVKISFGALINYPRGASDHFEYILTDKEKPLWLEKEIEGTWFPHAFMQTMQQMLLTKTGYIIKPENSIDDALMTMICVEAAYFSSENEGKKIDDFL